MTSIVFDNLLRTLNGLRTARVKLENELKNINKMEEQVLTWLEQLELKDDETFEVSSSSSSDFGSEEKPKEKETDSDNEEVDTNVLFATKLDHDIKQYVSDDEDRKEETRDDLDEEEAEDEKLYLESEGVTSLGQPFLEYDREKS